MSSPRYLINGKQYIAISPLDRGFSYGDGIFRTIALIAGEPRDWLLHYAKLVSDCRALGISCPDAEVLLHEIRQLAADASRGVIKIMVTRGEAARGYSPPAISQPTRVVMLNDWLAYPPAHFDHGVSLYLCQLRLSLQPALAGIKHLNRLENVLARMEWTDAAMADGLLLDIQGNVIECTMSNIFARYGALLLTPDLSQCGVAGITRQRIIEMASSLGLEIQVAQFSLSKLLQADEVIICNSLYGAWQVRQLEQQSWQAGTLASRLRTALLA